MKSVKLKMSEYKMAILKFNQIIKLKVILKCMYSKKF